MKDSGEIIGKTLTDCWVVGKLCDERELYVMLQQKNANIVDVNGMFHILIFLFGVNIFIVIS